MAIRLKCGNCGRALKVGDEHAGRKVKCPDCGEPLKIPNSKSDGPERRQRRASDVQSQSHSVLYKCAYGRLPKLMLYLGLPFLTAASVGLFVASFWFDVEFSLRNLPIPPELITFGLSPLLLLLVIGCLYVEVNQRKYPRRIVVRDDGILVPKGRVKTGEMLLSWKGLTAKITSAGPMTDVNLKNADRQKTRLNLMMFPTQEDFDGFLEALEDRATFV